MKIAVTASDNKGLETEVDSRFGRAPYFALVDADEMDIKFIDNTAKNEASGAGVSAAQLLVDSGADAVISGNFGPRAYSGLEAAGVKMYSVSGGKIKDVVEKLNNDELNGVNAPTSQRHSGLK